MLLHGISEPVVALIVLVLRNPLFETPVVGKTSYSCMLSKVRPLDVVRVQFIPVGLIGQHSGSIMGFGGSLKAHTKKDIHSTIGFIDVQICLGFVQLLTTL